MTQSRVFTAVRWPFLLRLLLPLFAATTIFLPAQTACVKNFEAEVGADLNYDDNLFYSYEGSEYSTWFFSVVPKLAYNRESSRLNFKFDYKGQGDVYFAGDSQLGPDLDLQTGNCWSNYFNLQLGYQMTNRLLLRVSDQIDNTNRPDFMTLDEMVFGKFFQNNLAAELDYRVTERLELTIGYGNRFLDYTESDDSIDHDFIDSRSHQLHAAATYYLSAMTNVSGHYRFNDTWFPEDPLLDYQDTLIGAAIRHQVNDQMFLRGEIGLQDRQMEYDFRDSDSTWYFQTELGIQRDRSTIHLGFSRDLSQAPNYSRDFYVDYALVGGWEWEISYRDMFRIDAGVRWNEFQMLPADFAHPTGELRTDVGYMVGAGYERRLQEHFLVHAKYQYMTRGSNNEYYEFNKNTFTVGCRYVFFKR